VRAKGAIEVWALAGVEPFGSGGVGYVYRARLRTGEAVVLKVEPAGAAWAPEAVDRALVVWSRAGLAPRVLASRDEGRTVLLELIAPGHRDSFLRAGDGWVVIDPKPVLAGPHAECFGLLAAAEYVTDLGILGRYARAADLPDPRLLARWVRIRALIAAAQRSESPEPTADSAGWDAHLRALARMLEPACR
jgi:hypothetical protein